MQITFFKQDVFEIILKNKGKNHKNPGLAGKTICAKNRKSKKRKTGLEFFK